MHPAHGEEAQSQGTDWVPSSRSALDPPGVLRPPRPPPTSALGSLAPPRLDQPSGISCCSATAEPLAGPARPGPAGALSTTSTVGAPLLGTGKVGDSEQAREGQEETLQA